MNCLKKKAAVLIGATALLSSILFLFFSPALALLPLGLFLLLCLTAPFLPCFSFFLPITCHGKTGVHGVALTFDDGPTPESTPILLDLLDAHDLKATFFVVGEKAAAHPELIRSILARGHTIGNHSLRHDPLLMLRRPKTLQADIHRTQEILQGLGVQPHVFRPPAGITNPHLDSILSGEGLITVNYSCRALDRGNRNISNLARKILARLQPGDIIMLHDLPPHQRDLLDDWQQELNRLFSALQTHHKVTSLEKVLQHPVMTMIQ